MLVNAVQKAYSFFTVSMSTNQKMNGLLFLIVELRNACNDVAQS
jgi:hypothetical protein